MGNKSGLWAEKLRKTPWVQHNVQGAIILGQKNTVDTCESLPDNASKGKISHTYSDGHK